MSQTIRVEKGAPNSDNGMKLVDQQKTESESTTNPKPEKKGKPIEEKGKENQDGN